MLEETAKVVAKDGYYVWVETTVQNGCSSCGSQGSCGSSLLSGLFKPRSNRMRVFDPFNLQVGERAVLGLPALELLKAAFIAYLLPLLLMMAIGVSATQEGFTNVAVMGLSLFGLMAGFTLVHLLSRKLNNGLARVVLLRREETALEQSVQFINL